MDIQLGTVAIDIRKWVVSGSYQMIRYRYTAGNPVDESGSLKIVFRCAGNFGTPQFENPTAANYYSVVTSGDCRIESHWDTKGHTRPWGKSLYLGFMGGLS